MVVMGVAFSTFDNALALNETATQLADASQNLRAGTNILVRDLMQAGRNIPIGGIAIPSGTNSTAIYRPSPPNQSYAFNNTTDTTLKAITTGMNLGPTVSGRDTDIITMIMDDPFLAPLDLFPSDAAAGLPRLALDGSTFDVGTSTAWLQGDPANGIAPVKVGDVLYFATGSGTALQTVTALTATVVTFAAGDPFNFNQRTAAAGSITQILPPPPSVSACGTAPACGPAMTVRRVLMYTYYVNEDTPGVPRLQRVLNHFPRTALAGVVEDLDISYDLVDGVNNPVDVDDLPYTANLVTYSATQIRKVNVHVGVRSEQKSTKSKDYLRSHVSTVISIRNLAYVDRYQ